MCKGKECVLYYGEHRNVWVRKMLRLISSSDFTRYPVAFAIDFRS